MALSWGLDDAWNAVRGLPKAAKHAAVEVKDTLEDGAEAAVDLAGYIKEHPPQLDQFKRTLSAVGTALRTGETALIESELPDYARLEPAGLEAARARGRGRTVPQPYITHDRAGHGTHEPVSLRVTGSLEDLAKALEAQGWRQAPDLNWKEALKMAGKMVFGTEQDTNGPVSRMYIDGQPAVMAFNKNDDFNAGRDHLRIFSAGTDPQSGEPVWQIAATRDIAATVTIPRPTFDGLVPKFEKPRSGHRTDPAIDHERDLIMHDLLASGVVKSWAAVEGAREGVAETPLPNGGVQIGKRTTDGLVYDVRL